MFGRTKEKQEGGDVEAKSKGKVRIKMVVTRQDGSKETIHTTGRVERIKDG